MRLKAESEILVMRHEKTLNQHSMIKAELDNYLKERAAQQSVTHEPTDVVETPKRKRQKDEGK